ncbi:MAG TPA: hypothetical protein EYH30_08210 [Anaerolineales bacterium]|nr:hypothetical protein [Anaerolineales bacterium]
MNGWFFPDLGDRDIITFINLLQTDGYNPPVVNVPGTYEEVLAGLLSLCRQGEIGDIHEGTRGTDGQMSLSPRTVSRSGSSAGC